MVILIVYTILCLVVLATDAYAYLDFGTGSYVLQILAASAIGFIFVIRNYLSRIKAFLFRKKPVEEKNSKTEKDPEK